MKPVRFVRTLLYSVTFHRLIRFCLGTVFVWSGAVKLFAPRDFAKIISAYGLVPDEFLVPIAIALPVVELLAGLGLIWNVKASLEVIFALIVFFLGVLWFGILKDLDIDCGCFSLAETREHDSLRNAFYRDFLFLAMAMFLSWKRRYGKERV